MFLSYLGGTWVRLVAFFSGVIPPVWWENSNCCPALAHIEQPVVDQNLVNPEFWWQIRDFNVSFISRGHFSWTGGVFSGVIRRFGGKTSNCCPSLVHIEKPLVDQKLVNLELWWENHDCHVSILSRKHFNWTGGVFFRRNPPVWREKFKLLSCSRSYWEAIGWPKPGKSRILMTKSGL